MCVVRCLACAECAGDVFLFDFGVVRCALYDVCCLLRVACCVLCVLIGVVCCSSCDVVCWCVLLMVV